jgi:hypothetical protein
MTWRTPSVRVYETVGDLLPPIGSMTPSPAGEALRVHYRVARRMFLIQIRAMLGSLDSVAAP